MNNNTQEMKETLMKQMVYELPVLRARLGASQADIADKIGISRQTYNSIETGKRELNWTVFLAMTAVFHENEETRVMLQRMDGMKEALGMLVQLQNE